MRGTFKKFLGLLTLLTITLTIYEKSFASHILGAEITYRCVSNLKFEVTFKFYRDCRGVPFANPTNETKVKCPGGGPSQTISLTLKSVRDISQVCDTVTNRCNPANTTISFEGMEEHVFVGTVDFNAAPYSTIKNGCCQVIFETGQCCRNGAINTGPAGNFYSYAMLDLCLAPTNSSPIYTVSPVGYLCCNQPASLHNGISDAIDHDSLSCSFADPLGDYTSKLSYNADHSYQRPFSAYWLPPLKYPYVNKNSNPPMGIYLDPRNGEIVFTPTKCDEVTVAVLEFKEWRKDSTGQYHLIGITRRDMQYLTKTCPGNNPPKITNSKFSYETFAGQELCFDVTTDDVVFIPPPPAPKPPPDSVRLEWNRGIPGATFTIINKDSLHESGRFCWTPDSTLVSSLPYDFVATARDNYCPRNARTSFTFSIYVKQKNTGGIRNNMITKPEVMIWPNPVAPEMGLNIFVPSTGNYSVFIRDLKGIEIESIDDLNQDHGLIDLLRFSKGCYFVEVRNKHGVYFEKLIIQ
jgi:hypothetical protein